MKTMTNQEFIAACNEYGISWNNNFEVSWNTGGTYGNCWNDTVMQCSPEAPKELTCLDGFLTEHFSDISYMQFRNISNAVETTETSNGDYYGGCVYGVEKKLSYGDLQEKLVSMNLLSIIDQNN